MDLEDDDPITLPKWPFYVGDAFLVGSAIAIAGLSGWNLSNWQVVSCVIAVALGAGLFVLPFIVEYQLRLKEGAESFTRGQAVLARRIEALAAQVEDWDERVSGLPGQVEATAQATDGIRELFGARLVAVEADIARLKKELSERLNALQASIPEAGGSDAAFASLSDKVEALDTRLRTLDAATASPQSKAEPGKKREKRTRKAQLLHRAMGEPAESGTPAVKRIISAGPKEKPAPLPDEASAPQEDESPPPPETPPLEDPPPEVKKAPVQVEAPPDESEKKEAAPEKSESLPESQDLLIDVPEGGGKRRSRPKADDAYVEANVFIGIGNRPYIRGSGGGLSWEKGVLMDFEEIGKWRWIAPSGCGEIEVAIYRNDEDPDRSGRHVLDPGGKLELKPEFE